MVLENVSILKKKSINSPTNKFCGLPIMRAVHLAYSSNQKNSIQVLMWDKGEK